MRNNKILVIDDSEESAYQIYDFLKNQGFYVAKTSIFDEGLKLLNEDNYEIVFFSHSGNRDEIIGKIKKLRVAKNDIDIVFGIPPELLSTFKDNLKEGLTDFILKPYKDEEILFVLDRILKKQGIEKKLDFLLYENVELIEIISLYRRLLRLVVNVDLDKLKNQLLDEILECTYGKTAILYVLKDENDEFLVYDRHRGETKLISYENKIPKEFIDNNRIDFYISRNELNLPIRSDEKLYCLVKVLGTYLKDGFTEKEFNKALHFCEFVPPAFDNGLKFELLKKCSVKNYETNAYYWDIFKDFVNKEIYKAVRYERKLSMLAIRIENLVELKTHHSEKTIKNAINDIVSSINNVIRESDWFVEKNEGNYLIFLTETDYFGALMAIPRIKKAIAGKCIVKGAQRVDEILVNISAVGLPLHGITLDTLLFNLEERLNLGRKSLVYKIDLHKNDFEGICNKILMLKSNHEEFDKRNYVWDKRQKGLFVETLLFLLDELHIHPRRRGVLYFGFFDGNEVMSFLTKRNYHDLSTKIYFFCNQNKELVDFPGIITVGSEKQMITNFYFLLSLNEFHTYMMLCCDDDYFESNDFLLVEELISKLQSEYHLQWQL